jgi:DTW domain-containing protein YfiP
MSVARRNSDRSDVREPRPLCTRCRRPISVCFCAGITPVATATRVLILQHPRERDVPIGTARLARLALQNAILRTDIDFSRDPVVCDCLAQGNAYLLFPGAGAVAVETAHFPSPITLVVLDGTWWQAGKLLKANPQLAALPRLRLTPARPSPYGQIRREPAAHCVATVEAIAHVLAHLEGDPGRMADFLRPFAGMVERQIHFATAVKAGRHRRAKAPRPARDPVPSELRERLADLVCVHGEANAWPHLHPDRAPAETVHWLAKRMATGEAFESVIAPRGRLAPSTCRHIKLERDVLAQGEGWDAFAERFRAFLRPTDVLLSWGHFPVATLAADSFRIENAVIDIRPIAGNVLRRRTGTVEECVGHLAIATPSAWALGRGGERLANLCAVVEKLCAWPAPSAP